MIVNYILFAIYIAIAFWIAYPNRKLIWKGICGGNGVPQPDELIKMAVLITLYIEFGQIQFLGEKPDYAYLGMQYTVLGISAFSAHQERILRNKKKNAKLPDNSGTNSTG